ncbi:MAG TPA: tetratricopeptide repeat protein, partial [Pseudomonadota bacterium]|nr:tetratricopeptide repeat protein [Pseudomonadota bacterium]
VAADTGDTQVWLKTGGFREFIDLQLTVEKTSRVREAVLLIDRSWIGDKVHLSPFAKDLAKSYIGALVAEPDRKQARLFTEALWNLSGSGDRVLRRQPEEGPAELPPDVKRALEVYTGAERRLRAPMLATDLIFENVSADGKDRLKLTVRRLPRKPASPDAAPAASQGSGADSSPGTDLAGIIRTNSALFGKPYLAIINKELKAAKDDQLKAKLVVMPDEVLMTLQLALIFQDAQTIMVSVHDGNSGHEVLAVSRAQDIDPIEYIEPWPRGSFLERANNQGGAAAVPAEQHKHFLVKADELRKVLYAIVLELDYLKKIAEFCMLVTQDEASALAEYRKRMEQDPQNYPATEGRLDRLGQVFLAHAMAPRALKTFKINRELHPRSARAVGRLAALYESQGEVSLASQHYQKALELVGADPGLPEPERQRLREAASSALVRLRGGR